MINPLLSFALPGGARGVLSVLIWHRVLPQQDAIFPEEMHAARFDSMLGWLKQHFNVLQLDEAVRRLSSRSLPPRALVITFDDGYADNVEVALPILQKHGLPATFFVASGFLDGGRMWNDTVIESVRGAPAGLLQAGALGDYALSGVASRRAAIDALLGRIKYLEPGPRQAAVEALAAAAGAALPDDLMMTSDQLRALAAAGMQIGAHTQTHPILAKLPDAMAACEISEGRRALQEIIGQPVEVFAYPNGRPQQDYLREHVDMVREQGFMAAVSTATGVSRAGDDLLQLRRFSPWDVSRHRFVARMARNALQRPYPELLG